MRVFDYYYYYFLFSFHFPILLCFYIGRVRKVQSLSGLRFLLVLLSYFISMSSLSFWIMGLFGELYMMGFGDLCNSSLEIISASTLQQSPRQTFHRASMVA